MTREPASRQYKDEATLLAKVIEWLEPQRRNGIVVLRICDRYHKGYSDLFINARGRFIVAELKDDTGKASPHQELFIEEMQRCGAKGGICRTVKEVSDLVDNALYCSCWYGRRIEAATSERLRKNFIYCPHCGKELRTG